MKLDKAIKEELAIINEEDLAGEKVEEGEEEKATGEVDTKKKEEATEKVWKKMKEEGSRPDGII